jgi:tRNA nucleotidyltransferase/poly(A) polymerase
MELFLVGGAVRDEIMGIKSKDWDFSVVLSEFNVRDARFWGLTDFEFMRDRLVRRGFEVFVDTPEFFTLRARGPKGFTFAGVDFGNQTFDFVMARKESGYTDGRRPDAVEAGDLMDDLSRRDFTVNAIAKDRHGNLIDPFHGRKDIADGVIRAVGNAQDRLMEDALRGLRAVRFAVQKGFSIDREVQAVLMSSSFQTALSSISTERQREELEKGFKVDTMKMLRLLSSFGLDSVLFNNTGLRLMPTMKG